MSCRRTHTSKRMASNSSFEEFIVDSSTPTLEIDVDFLKRVCEDCSSDNEGDGEDHDKLERSILHPSDRKADFQKESQNRDNLERTLHFKTYNQNLAKPKKKSNNVDLPEKERTNTISNYNAKKSDNDTRKMGDIVEQFDDDENQQRGATDDTATVEKPLLRARDSKIVDNKPRRAEEEGNACANISDNNITCQSKERESDSEHEDDDCSNALQTLPTHRVVLAIGVVSLLLIFIIFKK